MINFLCETKYEDYPASNYENINKITEFRIVIIYIFVIH